MGLACSKKAFADTAELVRANSTRKKGRTPRSSVPHENINIANIERWVIWSPASVVAGTWYSVPCVTAVLRFWVMEEAVSHRPPSSGRGVVLRAVFVYVLDIVVFSVQYPSPPCSLYSSRCEVSSGWEVHVAATSEWNVLLLLNMEYVVSAGCCE